MFTKIEDFLSEWKHETAGTQRLLDSLTDESLQQSITPKNRSLGRLVSHVITSPHEMLARTGLQYEAPFDYDHVPATAAEAAQAYRAAVSAAVDAIRSQWTDGDLSRSCDMYGEQWSNGFTLRVVISHEIHHRGQMTVLARQAGLHATNLYGPALEDWDEWGEQAPLV